MDYFPLTKKDIHEGLSDERMSELIGVKVTSIPFSALPFSKQLMNEHGLPAIKRLVRTFALHQKLRSAGNHFPFREALKIANNDMPIVLIEPAAMGVPQEISEYYKDIGELKPDEDRVLGPEKSSSLSFAVWGSFCEEQIIPVSSGRKTQNAFMIIPGQDMNAREFWSRAAFIPPTFLQHFPNDGAHIPFIKIHELVHPQQGAPESEAPIIRYYKELHADGVAITTLRQAGVGNETQAGALQTRYVRTLISNPSEWGAPTIEALQSKSKPPKFWEVKVAGMEIYLRLAMEMNGIQHRNLDSDTLHHAIQEGPKSEIIMSGYSRNLSVGHLQKAYKDLAYDAFITKKEPDRLLTPLRQLVEDGVFTADFSAHFAQRIVDAAESFNPALTHGGEWRPPVRMFNRPPPSPL